MATKIFCDGCGNEIPPTLNGLQRSIVLLVGPKRADFELCASCTYRMGEVLLERMPAMPPEWRDFMREMIASTDI